MKSFCDERVCVHKAIARVVSPVERIIPVTPPPMLPPTRLSSGEKMNPANPPATRPVNAEKARASSVCIVISAWCSSVSGFCGVCIGLAFHEYSYFVGELVYEAGSECACGDSGP